MKNDTLKMRKLMCAVLALALLISLPGGAVYADEGAVPPPVTEEDASLPETEEPSLPAIEEPADPEAAPPVTEEGSAEASEWLETYVQTGEQSAEEAFGEQSASQDAVPPQDGAGALSEAESAPDANAGSGEIDLEALEALTEEENDPLYAKRAGTPMTISVPASFDAVTPRALQSGETLRKGIDVSAYQGSIDWSAVASSGVEFAIIRVGYRGLKNGKLAEDTYFAQNLSGAKAAGLKVGAYFFSQAITPDEAREEAQYLMNAVSGYTIDLPLVFDFEEVTSSNRRLVMADLDRQTKTDICCAFCSEVEAAGYQSMVYLNPTMLNKDVYRESLGRLWLAHWTSQSNYAGEYEFWQFGVGYVSGVPGDVDLDYWFDPSGTAIPPLPGESVVEPTATPVVTPIPAPATPFTDVKATSWYCQSVLWAYENGIVDGMGDGTFAPGKTATRGQMTAMLYRMQGKPAVTGTPPFNDLKADYYKDAVNWAAANKIVNGTSEDTFNPNGQITREDLVTMLYRMSGSPAVSGDLGGFSDAGSVHAYARQAMIWAVGKGLIQGYDDNTIQPSTAANRAEVCTLLMRYSSLT